MITKIEKEVGSEIRKSLAVDIPTYEKLQSICGWEHRSKIDQLKVLIGKEYQRLSQLQENGSV
jgi:hypothetical protein